MIGFSPDFALKIQELRSCLFQKFYQHQQIAVHNKEAEEVLGKLFAYFKKNPEKALESAVLDQPVEVSIGDYIAGMTDQYALRMFQQIGS